MSRVGLIVNPISGMGGAVGLKGTDGVLEEARRRGAQPRASKRAVRALTALVAGVGVDLDFVTCSGAMGEQCLAAVGINPEAVVDTSAESTSSDTRRAARELVALGVDLLLFAGGDGTARDLYMTIGKQVPVIGIPTGVKMQSAVFAQTPEAAGRLAVRHLTTSGNVQPREVLDLDEDRLRKGVLAPHLYGHLPVPVARDLLQHPKRRSISAETERRAIAAAVLETVPADTLIAVGPGATAGAVLEFRELPHTLLGFDLVRDGDLVAADVNATDLLDVADEAYVVVAPTGNQGALLGRGNQVLTTEVLRRVGDRLLIVATRSRLAALSGRPLLVDLDDPELEASLCGVREVLVGPGRTMYYPVARP